MEVNFSVQGGVCIPDNVSKALDRQNKVLHYTLPSGEIVRLVVALEVEDKDGNFKYVTSEQEMAEYGFEALDYSECVFIEP